MQQLPPEVPVRARTASVPHLSYLQSGAVGAPVVVLLHGVGSSGETWAELLPLLDPAYRWILPDYRGHGESEAPEPPYVIDDFVSDLARLLDELGEDRVVVAGFSIGAVIALAFALAHPGRARSLVLLSSIAGRTAEEIARAEARLELIRTTPPAQLALQSAARWFTEDFAADRPQLVAAELAIVAGVEHAPYAASYEVLVRTDQLARAHEVVVPALIVTGEKDAGSTPEMSRKLAAAIPAADLHVIPGVKHYVHIEAAEQVADLINGFLSRTRSAGAPASG